ncbi:MAG: hypothetical protein Q4B61_13870 [Bacteroidales bacterium]|nr:hypothetical protein [Bacteroidales bacterium]
MSAIERFQKTLEEYKVQLQSGNNQCLTTFCKERHVNARAMTRWINDQGLRIRDLKRELLPDISNEDPQSKPMFASIELPPASTSELRDICIETGSSFKLSIGSCSLESLKVLMSHLNLDKPCSR